jgi:hypothetical protein
MEAVMNVKAQTKECDDIHHQHEQMSSSDVSIILLPVYKYAVIFIFILTLISMTASLMMALMGIDNPMAKRWFDIAMIVWPSGGVALSLLIGGKYIPYLTHLIKELKSIWK